MLFLLTVQTKLNKLYELPVFGMVQLDPREIFIHFLV